MATLKHPSFDTLPIIVGGKAKAGAFYVTYSGHYLSHIAQDAYGSGSITPIMRINKSKYNVQHCIYRQDSRKCSSLKILDENAIMAQPSSWASQAWLSLCNVDKAGKDNLGAALGVAYQVIWVPPVTGEEPWELEPIDDTEPLDPKKKLPGFKIPDGDIIIDVPKVPDIDIHIGDKEDEKRADNGGGEPEPLPDTKKAGFPWWLGALLGLGAISTVIYVAVKDRKKRGKKRKKAK
jgi:hypothetical protein